MKGLVFCLLFFALAICQPNAPTNLLVEYMPTPVLGVDVTTPRFFWTLSHPSRAIVQQSYQIQVAFDSQFSSLAWDSGQTKSSKSIQIPYAGKQLLSDTSYFWRVRWWDNKGASSSWSSVARFDTGLYQKSDWSGAQWIGGNNLIRTEFQLTKPISRARAFIVGLGYYEFRLNGNKVGDQSLGTFTTFEQRILYDSYDLTSLLQQGKNAIGIMLGRGWYTSLGVGPLSLIFKLSISFTDGSNTTIISDPSKWKTSAGPITSDDIYIGETYDARLEQPGWDLPNFNDAKWSQSQVQSGTYGNLSSQLNFPIKKTQSYTPKTLSQPKPGIFVFDFGQNVAGFVRLTVQGPRGGVITLQHGEELNPDGTLHSLYSNSPQIDTYILKGDGLETYEPRFTYHGFQYVQMTSSWGFVPNLDCLESHFVHTAFPEIGEVSFSEPLLNSIQSALRYASRANFMNIPTDCPQRERRGWMGDAQLSAESIIHNWDLGAAYTKWIRDIRDSQLFYMKQYNGHVGDCIPFYGHGSIPSDPAWGTAYTLIWFWMYKYYGDVAILQQYYTGVKQYIDALHSQSNNQTASLDFSIYGDWCAVTDGMSSGCAYPSAMTSTFYYLLELETFVKAAKLLGNNADATYYSQIATSVRSQWNNNFFHPSTHTYDKGYQTSQVLALWSNNVASAQKTRVVQYLLNNIVTKNNNHLTTGIVGTKYLLPTLTSLGRTDLAYTIATQTTFPSWGYMINQGATTLWENWQSSTYVSYGSKDHIMFGGQGVWYFQTLAGITMDESASAFDYIRIHPEVSQTPLKLASASLQTHKGLIYSSWYYPSSTTCVLVDENSNATITCSGGKISKILFASFGTPSGDCPDLKTGSCNAKDSVSIVSNYCLGKASCSVPATDTVFGDPCYGTPKQLGISVAGCLESAFTQEVTIPTNTKGSVHINKLGLSQVVINEGTQPVWQNNQFVPGTPGVVSATDHGTEIEFVIGSGSFKFSLFGSSPVKQCVSVREGSSKELKCPAGHHISRIEFASFGDKPEGSCGAFEHGSCYFGSSKHMVEESCLLKEKCVVSAVTSAFGDSSLCSQLDKKFLTIEYWCAN